MVTFVINFTNKFFEKILKGHNTFHGAMFINNDSHVLLFLSEPADSICYRLGIGNELCISTDFTHRDLCLFANYRDHKVSQIEDLLDLIGILSE